MELYTCDICNKKVYNTITCTGCNKEVCFDCIYSCDCMDPLCPECYESNKLFLKYSLNFY